MTEERSGWPELEFRCNGGAGCVIVERIAGVFIIRDSKNPSQPGLVFSKKEYTEFRRRIQSNSWPWTVLRYATSALRSLAMIVHVAR